MAVGIPKRQAGKATQPKDQLDSLMDQLDALEIRLLDNRAARR